MWLFLNDCFLSIVSKDCARDELLVRARRKGDIEKIFPAAKVQRSPRTDYLFRSVIKREAVEQAMLGELRRITYPNFKDSVKDDALHDTYHRVWLEMAKLQPTGPFMGGVPLFKSIDFEENALRYHAGEPTPYCLSVFDDKPPPITAEMLRQIKLPRKRAAKRHRKARGKQLRKGQ